MAMTRREMLAAGAAAAGSAIGSTSLGLAAQEKAVKSGRLKQSVCRWCYDAVLGPRCGSALLTGTLAEAALAERGAPAALPSAASAEPSLTSTSAGGSGRSGVPEAETAAACGAGAVAPLQAIQVKQTKSSANERTEAEMARATGRCIGGGV